MLAQVTPKKNSDKAPQVREAEAANAGSPRLSPEEPVFSLGVSG